MGGHFEQNHFSQTGAGFIGGNFVPDWLAGSDEPVLNLDKLTYVTDRLGHDRRYAIDARKLEAELGWKPAETFETGIRKTVHSLKSEIETGVVRGEFPKIELRAVLDWLDECRGQVISYKKIRRVVIQAGEGCERSCSKALGER